MKLDFGGFEKAVFSLKEAVDFINSGKFASLSVLERKIMKSGVIQNFEFTYEICWKFMTRWLKLNLGKDRVEGVSRRELFRLARENRLISDIEKWMTFHQARNETSHTYDQNKADEIVGISAGFLGEAQSLLDELKKRND